MEQKGWVKLFKKFTDWHWYKHSPTKDVFIHLLLTVNTEDKQWKGITVKRGQRIVSERQLAEETGLTRQNVRTSIEHLLSTQEVTQEVTTNQPKNFRLLNIVNYDSYQMINPKVTQKSTPTKEDKKKRRKEFIYITDGEMEKLTDVLGPHLEDYLTRLDLYIGSHGDKYKNHYYTLLTWYRKDHPSPTQAAAPLPKKYKTSEEIDAEFNALTQKQNEDTFIDRTEQT